MKALIERPQRPERSERFDNGSNDGNQPDAAPRFDASSSQD